MSGNYLLDTNVVIKFLNNDEKAVLWFTLNDGIYVSNIVLGELYYGACYSKRRELNLTKIKGFIEQISVINTNIETAAIYGNLKDQLRKKGKPIPENDVWIAAQSFQYGLTLVTYDSHFEFIPDLSIEKWK